MDLPNNKSCPLNFHVLELEIELPRGIPIYNWTSDKLSFSVEQLEYFMFKYHKVSSILTDLAPFKSVSFKVLLTILNFVFDKIFLL